MIPQVLVVEDEDALSTLLQYNLEKEGYAVRLSADGEDALVQVDERMPDLIVLDWMLPKISGIEVCRRLRSRSETRNVPIVMLTARGEESDRIRGLDTGARRLRHQALLHDRADRAPARGVAPHPPGFG